MKRLLLFLCLGLIAYAIFMVVQLPATVIGQQLSQRLPGFSVEHAEGTASAGSFHNLQLHRRALGQVGWDWQPLALLLGRLGFALQLTEPKLDIQAQAAIGLDRQLHLQDVQGQLPLPRAIQLAGRPPPPVIGEVTLDLERVDLSSAGQPQTVVGDMHLDGVRTAFGKSLHLGDYHLAFKTRDQTITGVINDKGGPLKVSGVLAISPQSTFHLQARLSVRPGSDTHLSTALRLMLGSPGKNGQWTINYRGTLTAS